MEPLRQYEDRPNFDECGLRGRWCDDRRVFFLYGVMRNADCAHAWNGHISSARNQGRPTLFCSFNRALRSSGVGQLLGQMSSYISHASRNR